MLFRSLKLPGGLVHFLRRREFPPDVAQDHIQEFFMRVIEGRYLDRADPEKGRFRSASSTSMICSITRSCVSRKRM